MEKERKIRMISLIALLVAIIGLTVAFAAMSRTLTIKGTTTVDAATWDIKYINLSGPTIRGTAKEISAPSISADGSKIEGINVSVSKPGDQIIYYYDILNNGTIDAEFSASYWNDVDLTTSEFTDEVWAKLIKKCDWNGDGSTTTEERQTCMQNIQIMSSDAYAIPYASGNKYVIPAGKKFSEVETNFEKPFDSDGPAIVIWYNNEATEMPKGEVEIDLNFRTVFTQAK